MPIYDVLVVLDKKLLHWKETALWNKWFWFTGWNTVYFYLEIYMAQLYYGLWRPWYSMILWIVTTLVLSDVMDWDDFGTQWYYGLWRPWYSMISWIVTTLVLNDIMDCDDFGTSWCHGLWRLWYSIILLIVKILVLNDIMDCDDLGTQWYYGLWRPWMLCGTLSFFHSDILLSVPPPIYYFRLLLWYLPTFLKRVVSHIRYTNIYYTHILFNELSKYMSYLNSK
jgi:hypothetical protein